MRKFWGRGADAAPTSGPTTDRQPVRTALLAAIARGEAGPPFQGTVGPWLRREDHAGAGHAHNSAIDPHDESVQDHPAGYIAHHPPETIDGVESQGDELVHAVNAALMLGKPLLLTGNPGTGKSELAERLAWEFNLGPVLRFESQSLSEANDLYYRFDLVGRLAGVESLKAAAALQDPTLADRLEAGVARHLSFGPLGKAILRCLPAQIEALAAKGLRADDLVGDGQPRPSVVLIDEIDKTSRDFPNDLLNAIERQEFKLRDLDNRLLKAPDDDALRPIVLITSNSERELPAPFLRRCIYYHIPDPRGSRLARILRSRVRGSGSGPDPTRLHPLYADLLQLFGEFQKQGQNALAYQPGTQELLDLARVIARSGRADPDASLRTPNNHELLRQAAGTMLKHRDDQGVLTALVRKWRPT